MKAILSPFTTPAIRKLLLRGCISCSFACQSAQAVNYWFDQNNTSTGFSVANGSSYNWSAANVWNTLNTGGAGTLVTWSGLSGNNAGFFTGAGTGGSGTYTVRLGADGSNNVALQNFWLNSNGAATVVANGTGNVVIGNSGDTGELQISASNSIGSASGTLTINNPLNLGLNKNTTFRNGSITFNGVVSGTGTSGVILAVGGGFPSGTGTLTLANTDNTYTGATTINAGYTLAATKLANGLSSSSIGASSNAATNLVLNGGTLRYTGGTASTDRNFTLSTDTTGTINVLTAGTILTLSGASTATNGGLTKAGNGTLKLTGTNLNTGAITVSAGTLSVATIGDGGVAGNLGAASTGSANLVLGNATLQYTGSTAATNRNFTITAGTAISIEITNSGTALTMSGQSSTSTGGLTKTGPGTLIMSGSNNYTGATTINEGVLSVATIHNGGVAGPLGKSTNAAANLVLGGGTLRYTGATAGTDRNFTLTTGTNSTLEVTNAATTLTLSGSSASTTGGLIKTGAGTLVLAGTSNHSGTTTVAEGTLQVNGTLANTSTLIVEVGATLNGLGLVAGPTTVLGSFSPGNSIGEMTFSNGLSLAGSSNFEIDPTVPVGLTSDLAIITSGSLNFGGVLNVTYGGPAGDFTEGQIFNLFDWIGSGPSGSFSAINLPSLSSGLSWQNHLTTNGTFVIVPEPNAVALAALGAAVLLRRRRTRA